MVGRELGGLRGGGRVGGHFFLGALAGRSERPDSVKTAGSPLEYVAVIAPAVFIIGLVIAVSVLATALQGLPVGVSGALVRPNHHFLSKLSHAVQERTWAVMLASAFLAMVT